MCCEIHTNVFNFCHVMTQALCVHFFNPPWLDTHSVCQLLYNDTSSVCHQQVSSPSLCPSPNHHPASAERWRKWARLPIWWSTACSKWDWNPFIVDAESDEEERHQEKDKIMLFKLENRYFLQELCGKISEPGAPPLSLIGSLECLNFPFHPCLGTLPPLLN